MKKIFSIIAFTLISSLLLSQGMTINSAINKAGRQRMLSQRIVKAYIMIGSGFNVDQARKELDESVALFEQQFLELEEYAPTDDIKNGIVNVDKYWSKYRMLAVDAPNKLDALILIARSNDLLNACDEVVTLFEDYSGKKSAKLVNISGRQRMLSQRIAMLYFANYWGFPENDIVKVDIVENFDIATDLFLKSLKKLKKSSKNTDRINEGLSLVDSYWNIPRNGLNNITVEDLSLDDIYISTNKILNEMNEITGLYEKVMDD